MSKTNSLVFKALYIIAWLIFVGLSIEAGGLVVNFFFHLYRPDFVVNLYQKLDLREMLTQSRASFFGIYSLILSIALLKSFLFYIVIRLMHTMNLSKPFDLFCFSQILRISYFTLSVGF
ncbi:hypothetical protein [Candidatus Pollutiaquabacter sp.]|uniref:hypothetical protein n=1 Tax=Candidatus Pollutiaquabacter sp. TaxID=3416354 RepID=UPI003D1419EF